MTINRMTILILYMNIYYCTDCILHWKQWCSDNGGNCNIDVKQCTATSL